MLTKLLGLAIAFAASTAAAATQEPTVAIRQDAERIWYHDAELRIAETDLAAAGTVRAMAQANWDDAVAHHKVVAAGVWARRHFAAMQAEREARGRVLLHRAEHDIARQDFERDANWVRAEARLSTRKRG